MITLLILFGLLYSNEFGDLSADSLLTDRGLRAQKDFPRTPVGKPKLWTGRASVVNGLTDSVIRNDFLCNDDTNGGCPQRAPDAAIGKDGNFVVAWCDFRDGDADIWIQRFDSSGHALGENRRVNTDVTLGWQGDPAVAMDSAGNFIISWEDRREIGNSDVFAQRFDRTGRTLGDNFRVSDSGVPGDQSISSLYTAPDGVTLVVWDDRRNGLGGDIFGQFLNPDGSLRGSNFQVNDDGRVGNQYEPDVSGDDSGRFVVVWEDGRNSNWDIFFQRFKSDGTRLGNNVQITVDTFTQQAPQVACASDGRFLVCWDDERAGDWDIYARIYDSSGQPAGPEFRVNSDVGETDQYGGGCAVNRFGEFLIVWTDKREGNEDIYARLFDRSGRPLGTEFRVNTDTGTDAQNSPTVVAAPDGGYWVFWSDARNGNFDIYGQRISRNGVKLGANFRVNDDFASAHQRISSIGMEKRGNILIAWEDERGKSCDIYGVILDSLGRTITSNFRINDDTWGYAAQYYSAVAGGNQKFIVAWSDNRGGWDIYAQFFDSQGERIGRNFRVNSDPGSSIQWYPYCAMDASNRSVVVWTDYRRGKNLIYARLLDQNGNPVGDDFAVTDTADTNVKAAYASVAMNSTGYWVVSWMDEREKEPNIYCQLFRPDGSRIGGNFRVNTDPGRNYQGYPSCAIAEDRTIAIAWEDRRNGCYNVYLQWLDSLGNRIGENERVNDDPGGSDCYSPSCAFDPSGRLIVLFNDEREMPGNPQIYCQRYRPDRTRIGNNAQINQPNYFPKNTHWTVGQSVAACNSRIAWTWTENRRHLGWDIFAKLTDWNLVGLKDQAAAPIINPERSALPTIIRHQTKLKVTGPRGTIVKLYDVMGNKRRGGRVESRVLIFDLTGLNCGTYFLVTTKSRGDSEVKKLILQ